VRYPALRYDTRNIWAACTRCNALKGSLDIEELPQLTESRRAEIITLRDSLISALEVRELAGVGKREHQDGDDDGNDEPYIVLDAAPLHPIVS
jgi:hypothetical protein